MVEEWLAKGDYFLVDIQMCDDDRIVIEIDCVDGVWIEDCAELSRFLQEKQVPEGKKRPVKVEVDREFSIDEVKSTRYLLAFK